MALRLPSLRSVLVSFAVVAVVAFQAAAQTSDDVLYLSHHPRLLFGSGELPSLRTRVRDGGADDDAYAFVRDRFETRYVNVPLDSLILNDFAQEPIVNIGLAAYLEDPVDSVAVDLGKRLTQYIARSWGIDTEAYGASLRLRSLAIGYDLYFASATLAERLEIQDEAKSYMDYMMSNLNYDIWLHSPYVSNKTAMVASSLGLAAICFEAEFGSAYAQAALAKADQFYAAWCDAHLADDACYREGALYACWSLRNLVYYFEARRRFDGYDYASTRPVREMEEWLAYELDPRGDARLNNIQDLTDFFRPLARHATYMAWATQRWASPLSSYIWDHAVGVYGRDMGDEADKASTVLWYEPVTPAGPALVLPKSRLWPSRGLYYFRTGWPDGAASDDVVVSFYSGEFRGGHAQEDQNQFTITAYGQKLVQDQGAGSLARQTEAHNIVRIDGAGQHNAGGSIGTDGRIDAYLSSDFADYVCGDASAAYSTHSEYNNTGVPYPWSDWSWGSHGANPVERADRRLLVVHEGSAPPYALVQDDILKDGDTHHFDWRVHVPEGAAVNSVSEPMVASIGDARLEIHSINPPRPALGVSVTPFNNGAEDPSSSVITLGVDSVNPKFTFLLIPLRITDIGPAVVALPAPGGTTTVLTWPQGNTDTIVSRTLDPDGPLAPASTITGGIVTTDALLAVLRTSPGRPRMYLAVETTRLSCDSLELVRIDDGPVNVAFDGSRVHIDRADAAFRILAPDGVEVYSGHARIPTIRDGEYLTNALLTGAGSTPSTAMNVRAYPNPFNPTVRITFATSGRERVIVDLHDVAGRRVAVLRDATFPAGNHVITWDGTDGRGKDLPSGVYLARVRAGEHTRTIKLALIR